MADGTDALGTISEAFKNFVTALRDGILLVVFGLLLLTPATIRDRLEAAGFKRGTIGGLEWEAELKAATERTKDIGQTVGQAQDNYQQLVAKLEKLEQTVTDPSVKAEIKTLGEEVERSNGKLKSADKLLKTNLATQQAIVDKIAPGAA